MQKPLAILIAAWGLSAGVGLAVMLDYELTPAPTTPVALHWPNAAQIVRDSARPTLALFLHPHCPCSRATLHELGLLVSNCEQKFALHVVLVCPPGADGAWKRSSLYELARNIPTAVVTWDSDGSEAARFGASTSGEALLYAPVGRLLFHGGLTPSRGHEGDNQGRAAVASLILTGRAACNETPVFGCSLPTGLNTGP